MEGIGCEVLDVFVLESQCWVVIVIEEGCFDYFIVFVLDDEGNFILDCDEYFWF